MSFTRGSATHRALQRLFNFVRARMVVRTRKGSHSGAGRITALPYPVMVQILIPGTSVEDKKSLRQVCKEFRLILDDHLVCINNVYGPLDVVEKLQCCEKFMKRIQHTPSIMTVELMAMRKIENMYSAWLQSLPMNLTTLKVHGRNRGNYLDAKCLARLSCLTSLILGGITVTGMEHVSGLTHLHCDTPVGSLAHLAPTLKHLSIHAFDDVQHINQLTCVEILAVRCYMPSNFFQTHGQLPLRCISILPFASEGFFGNTDAWQLAPSTLTRLCIIEIIDYNFPRVLPQCITHLQMERLHQNNIEEAAVALPNLRRLDVGVFTVEQMYRTKKPTFNSVSKLSNLESMGLWYVHGQAILGSMEILKRHPELAIAIERGVKLNIMKGPEEFLDVFKDPWDTYAVVKTAWSIV